MNHPKSKMSTIKNWKVNFFTIWGGQAISQMGSYLVGFAFVWYLTETTGSPTVLAIGSLMNMLPQIIVSPFAGVLIDRLNRKTVMLFSDIITAAFTLLLGVLFALDSVQIWQIYLVMFIRNVGGVFQWSAMTVSTTLMVPKKALGRIQGLNQTLYGLLTVATPPLGALLISWMATENILYLDVITAAIAVAALAFMPIPQPQKAQAAPGGKPSATSIWQDLREGLKYISTTPALKLIILIAMLVNFLLKPVYALLPLLVTAYFEKGAIELGLLEAISGIGMVIGGLLLSLWGGLKNQVHTTLLALVLAGLGLAGLRLVPPDRFFLGTGLLAIVGFTYPFLDGPLNAILQARVPPEKQGRVFSLYWTGAALASPLGYLSVGPIADHLGLLFWFMAGGIIIALTGITGFFITPWIAFGRIAPPEAMNPNPIPGQTKKETPELSGLGKHGRHPPSKPTMKVKH